MYQYKIKKLLHEEIEMSQLAKQLYEDLTKIDHAVFKENNYKKIQKSNNIEDLKIAISYNTLGKIAHCVEDVEAFIDAVENNNFPLIKLSNKDSELVKGGGWWADFHAWFAKTAESLRGGDGETVTSNHLESC